MKQRLAFLLFTLLGLTFEGFAQVSVQGRILGISNPLLLPSLPSPLFLEALPVKQ